MRFTGISAVFVKSASVLLVLYFLFSAIDLVYSLWATRSCPLPNEVSQISPEQFRVLSLANSDDPAEMSQAAEYLYESGLIPDDETQLGFRNRCLAEDMHRAAAARGSEVSRDWLVQYYGRSDFPQVGVTHTTNSCASAAWSGFTHGVDAPPSKPWSLTRYFHRGSCDLAGFMDSAERITVESAIRCAVRRKS